VRRAAVLALIILALALCGCEQTAAAKGVQGDQIGDKVTVVDKDGEPVSIGPRFADELKKFPVPQGFGLGKGGFGTMMSRGDVVAVASWSGGGSVSGLIEFFRKSLPQQGWTEYEAFSSDQSAQLTSFRTQSQATITLEKEGSDIKLSVAIGRISEGIPTPVPTPTVAPPTATPVATASPVAGSPSALLPSLATFTPEPVRLGDASSVPAEMKEMPVPAGFKVVDGSTRRIAQGGALSMAASDWFGSTAPRDVGAFYKSSMGRDWNEDAYGETANGVSAQYSSKRDSRLTLMIEISRFEPDTIVHMGLLRSK